MYVAGEDARLDDIAPNGELILKTAVEQNFLILLAAKNAKKGCIS